MRDRLVEIIQNAVGGCARHWAEMIADSIIDNAGFLPPCKLGETIYMVVTKTHRKRVKKDGESKIVRSQHTFIKTTRLTKLNFFNVIDRFGKTVFLSKEEAKKAIKECK